jgi:hypothetical protein
MISRYLGSTVRIIPHSETLPKTNCEDHNVSHRLMKIGPCPALTKHDNVMSSKRPSISSEGSARSLESHI